MNNKNKKQLALVNKLLLGNKAVIIVFLLALFLTFASPVFLTSVNLLNVLRQVCVSTILACGFAMILGNGDIDLSVGSVVGFTGICVGNMLNRGMPIILAVLLTLCIGAAIGAVNATILNTFKLPAFIVTLATQQIIRGACYLITNMIPVTGVPESFCFIGQGYVAGIPFPVFIMAAAVIIVWILINRTKFGRYLLAIGGNAEAARVCGINVKRMKIFIFMASGICSTVAGLVLTARSASAQPTGGLNMEMDAIAAVVVGGTSMSGGKVNVAGAFFGCLIVGLISNGLNLLGINTQWQTVAKGLLILFAVVLDSVSTTLFQRMEQKRKLKEVA